MPIVLVFAIWILLWDVGTNFPDLKRLLMGLIDQLKFRIYCVLPARVRDGREAALIG